MILFYQSSRKLLLIIAAAASLRVFLSNHTVEGWRVPPQEATEVVGVLGKVSSYTAMVPLRLLRDRAGNTPLGSVISIQLINVLWWEMGRKGKHCLSFPSSNQSLSQISRSSWARVVENVPTASTWVCQVMITFIKRTELSVILGVLRTMSHL